MNNNIKNILKYLKMNKNLYFIGTKILSKEELDYVSNYIKNEKMNCVLDIKKISNDNYYVSIEKHTKN